MLTATATCSVLNTFKNMVNEDGILEKEDMYILARMKEFASDEEVVNFAAAKQLLILVERVVCIFLKRIQVAVLTDRQ